MDTLDQVVATARPPTGHILDSARRKTLSGPLFGRGGLSAIQERDPVGHERARAGVALMTEDGTFYIAVPQIAALNLIRPNQASRDLKRIQGKGFQFDQLRTELHPKAVNCVTTDQFLEIVKGLAKKGNESAFDFLMVMAGLSLRQPSWDTKIL